MCIVQSSIGSKGTASNRIVASLARIFAGCEANVAGRLQSISQVVVRVDGLTPVAKLFVVVESFERKCSAVHGQSVRVKRVSKNPHLTYCVRVNPPVPKRTSVVNSELTSSWWKG